MRTVHPRSYVDSPNDAKAWSLTRDKAVPMRSCNGFCITGDLLIPLTNCNTTILGGGPGGPVRFGWADQSTAAAPSKKTTGTLGNAGHVAPNRCTRRECGRSVFAQALPAFFQHRLSALMGVDQHRPTRCQGTPTNSIEGGGIASLTRSSHSRFKLRPTDACACQVVVNIRDAERFPTADAAKSPPQHCHGVLTANQQAPCRGDTARLGKGLHQTTTTESANPDVTAPMSWGTTTLSKVRGLSETQLHRRNGRLWDDLVSHSHRARGQQTADSKRAYWRVAQGCRQ